MRRGSHAGSRNRVERTVKVSGGKNLEDRERAARAAQQILRSNAGFRQLLKERYGNNPSFFVQQMQGQERYLTQALDSIEKRFKVRITDRPRREYDPRARKVATKFRRALRIGVGKIAGPAHGYLGRHVLDLGDRHAHAIVDIPWDSLKTTYGKIRAKFDPWSKALRGSRARLLAVRNPKPSGPGDRVIVEAHIHVPREKFLQLRKSGEFDLLDRGLMLARRGRKKKATNIFVSPDS